ncbi:hypothetical protein [Parasphingopyxis marina]|uniref:Lipoprotein n=1 Tax=Parasphingopyxis marina TaxID=2761622 RepID=A0A842HYA5_9SPHN|nr:hypothetical protein [Parasphingopyxis marina]MBC2777912.1 hypothetical protein [Parasphingopyxis marina]
MRAAAALLACAALLAACDETPQASVQDSPSIVTEEEAQQAEQQPIFRAVGQEPGWTVHIYPDVISYRADYGERTVTVPTPEVTEFGGGRRYETQALTVEILEDPCSDAMSGAYYPATVTVTENGRPLVQGCGGPP